MVYDEDWGPMPLVFNQEEGVMSDAGLTARHEGAVHLVHEWTGWYFFECDKRANGNMTLWSPRFHDVNEVQWTDAPVDCVLCLAKEGSS